MSAIDLRLGDYREALKDVERVDSCVSDPPYSERTHIGSDAAADRSGDGAERNTIAYRPWTPDDVREFVGLWAPRVNRWFAMMTDDFLAPSYRAAYAEAGWYDFAPVPILQHRPRLSGDGPGSGAVYLMVARPRRAEFKEWGSLPCWYMSTPERGAAVMGAKSVRLMRAIIRDYSRPGDLVCDPCAGGATTLIAAQLEHRNAIGAELDADTHAKALARIEGGSMALRSPQQERMW